MTLLLSLRSKGHYLVGWPLAACYSSDCLPPWFLEKVRAICCSTKNVTFSHSPPFSPQVNPLFLSFHFWCHQSSIVNSPCRSLRSPLHSQHILSPGIDLSLIEAALQSLTKWHRIHSKLSFSFQYLPHSERRLVLLVRYCSFLTLGTPERTKHSHAPMFLLSHVMPAFRQPIRAIALLCCKGKLKWLLMVSKEMRLFFRSRP